MNPESSLPPPLPKSPRKGWQTVRRVLPYAVLAGAFLGHLHYGSGVLWKYLFVGTIAKSAGAPDAGNWLLACFGAVAVLIVAFVLACFRRPWIALIPVLALYVPLWGLYEKESKHLSIYAAMNGIPKRAAAGDAPAQYIMYTWHEYDGYINGCPIPREKRSKKEAYAWLMKSYKAGFPLAACAYGNLLLSGGPPPPSEAEIKNEKQREEWRKRDELIDMLAARQQGKPPPPPRPIKEKKPIEILIPQDVPKGLAILEKNAVENAEVDCGDSYFSIASAYHYGIGPMIDMAKAMEYYEKAALAGNYISAKRMSQLYFEGDGVHYGDRKKINREANSELTIHWDKIATQNLKKMSDHRKKIDRLYYGEAADLDKN